MISTISFAPQVRFGFGVREHNGFFFTHGFAGGKFGNLQLVVFFYYGNGNFLLLSSFLPCSWWFCCPWLRGENLTKFRWDFCRMVFCEGEEGEGEGERALLALTTTRLQRKVPLIYLQMFPVLWRHVYHNYFTPFFWSRQTRPCVAPTTTSRSTTTASCV